MKNKTLGSKVNALSCYDLKTGNLVMTLRLRVHIPNLHAVGRHNFLESEDTPLVSLVLKVSDLASTAQAKAAARSVNLEVSDHCQLNTLESVSETSLKQTPAQYAWLEHFPWEKPKQLLIDALQAHVLGGKTLDTRLSTALALHGICFEASPALLKAS